mgnify:CR=1 FL=1
MMRISYSRMFWGTTLVNLVFSVIMLILFVLLRIVIEEEASNEDISYVNEYILGCIMDIIFSPVYGLLAMLILKIFGKKEEVALAKEEPKEKIVYVIKEEPKEQKENKEDDTRYMPR